MNIKKLCYLTINLLSLILSSCIAGGQANSIYVTKINNTNDHIRVDYYVNAGKINKNDNIYIGYSYFNIFLKTEDLIKTSNEKINFLKLTENKRLKQYLSSTTNISKKPGKYLLIITSLNNSIDNINFSSIAVFNLNNYTIISARPLKSKESKLYNLKFRDISYGDTKECHGLKRIYR